MILHWQIHEEGNLTEIARRDGKIGMNSYVSEQDEERKSDWEPLIDALG